MTQPHILNQQYPNVVLVGRTNAGKSTLFNRLTDQRRAIVSPLPNTTRDQNRDLVHWKGHTFTLIDTGGLDMTALDPLDQDIQDQVSKALAKAEAVILVIDGRGECLPQDMAAALQLQKLSVPVIVCLNKCENVRLQHSAEATFSRLPFDTLIPCSAKNGVGTAELLDAVFKTIAPTESPVSTATGAVRLTIIGQPNVGKSSLFNAFVGEDQVIVNPEPHTTRDPHDTTMQYGDRLFTIIDTAGLRRQNRVGHGTSKIIELLSTRATKEQLMRADVVILMIEAQRRVVHQDKALIEYLKDHGKSYIVVVNKWDLIPNKTSATLNEFMRYYRQQFQFAEYVPFVFTSVVEHQRLLNILDLVGQVYDWQRTVMPDEQLDTVLRRLQYQQPKERRREQSVKPKRVLQLDALKQTGVAPVRFALVTPRPKNVAPAVIARVEKMIREVCPFMGVPISIQVVTKA